MRTIHLTKTISGAASSDTMSIEVAERNETSLRLHITICVDRDCLCGEDKGLYRAELRLLFEEAMNTYFRTQ